MIKLAAIFTNHENASHLSDGIFAEHAGLTILTPADIGADEYGSPDTLHVNTTYCVEQ